MSWLEASADRLTRLETMFGDTEDLHTIRELLSTLYRPDVPCPKVFGEVADIAFVLHWELPEKELEIWCTGDEDFLVIYSEPHSGLDYPFPVFKSTSYQKQSKASLQHWVARLVEESE